MPPGKKTKNATLPVEAHVHKKDKRKNIPTAELQDFVREDETKPKKISIPAILLLTRNRKARISNHRSSSGVREGHYTGTGEGRLRKCETEGEAIR